MPLTEYRLAADLFSVANYCSRLTCLFSLFVAHGFSAIIIAAQDFGQVAVNSSPASLTLTYSFRGLSAAPSFALAWSRDFQIVAPSCVGVGTTNCSVTIEFAPARPGLRQDALVVNDQGGNLLATTRLHGIGTAPLIALYPGIVTTLAGNVADGYQNSPDPTLVEFWGPQAVALDGSGTFAYVADSVNGAIRKITLSSGAVTTVAGTGNNDYAGDGGPATSALLDTPTGVAVDGGGNLYIADQGNNVIRRVDAATQVITTVAGGSTNPSGTDLLGDGGPAIGAILNGPHSVAVDSSGNLYIADTYNQLIRTVNAATGMITVVAGGGTSAGGDGLGDDGPAIFARLANPMGIALDSAGNLYIADTGNNLIRRVDMAAGIITVVAGNGNWGYSGDSGSATSATLASPRSVAVDAAGNVYVADYGNNAIRLISAASQNISSVAGRGSTGYYGDGGDPTVAYLTSPIGIAVGEDGNLYIGDSGNNVIRQVSHSPWPLSFVSEPVGAVTPAQVVSPLSIGNQSLTVSAIALTSSFQQVSTGPSDCAVGAVLAPGSTCDAAVTFAPTQTGAIPGSMALTTNSLNNASVETVSLSGTGSTGAGPRISLSATGLVFGPQLVATASAMQTVTVTNSGGSPFAISSIQLSGSQTFDFQISTTCGSSVAAGANCIVSVTFTPTASGARRATLLFNDSVVGTPQNVALNGIGLSPGAASLNPTVVSLGSQPVDTTSAAQTVTLSNPGGGSLSISGISLAGAEASDFALSTTCGALLAAAANCTISVTFTPAATGSRTATVLVHDSAAGSPQSIAVSGTGSSPPAPSLSPTALSFSPQLVGTTSAAQTVKLSNVASVGLSISGISLGEAQVGDYPLSTTCGGSLPVGAKCTISVAFSPQAPGSRNATLLVSDSAAGSPQSLSLSGIGFVHPRCPLCGRPRPTKPLPRESALEDQGPTPDPNAGGLFTTGPQTATHSAQAHAFHDTVAPPSNLWFFSFWQDYNLWLLSSTPNTDDDNDATPDTDAVPPSTVP